MKNYLVNKEKHDTNFSNVMYDKYRQMRYGINDCNPSIDYDLASMRKELAEWQSYDDAGALSDTNIQYQTWLPVEYDNVLYSRGGQGYIMSGSHIGPQRLAVNYAIPGTSGSQNIIEVNSGGCVTRINLNPSIVINNNSSFSFSQNTPATMWDIIHNMNMIPNVFTEDLDGIDIQGVLEVVDNNRIKIYFNQAVAGKAYLS